MIPTGNIPLSDLLSAAVELAAGIGLGVLVFTIFALVVSSGVILALGFRRLFFALIRYAVKKLVRSFAEGKV